MCLLKPFFEAAPGFVESFGEDASFGDDGNEIGVREPARQDVHMEVSGDACAGGLADVHAQVNAVGGIDLAEDVFGFLCEGHHFLSGLGGHLLKFVQVGVGDDHEVAGGVGKFVQHDEVVRGAVNDKRFAVVGFGLVAENAAGHFVSGGNIGITPRCPKIVHAGSYNRSS